MIFIHWEIEIETITGICNIPISTCILELMLCQESNALSCVKVVEIFDYKFLKTFTWLLLFCLCSVDHPFEHLYHWSKMLV